MRTVAVRPDCSKTPLARDSGPGSVDDDAAGALADGHELRATGHDGHALVDPAHGTVDAVERERRAVGREHAELGRRLLVHELDAQVGGAFDDEVELRALAQVRALSEEPCHRSPRGTRPRAATLRRRNEPSASVLTAAPRSSPLCAVPKQTSAPGTATPARSATRPRTASWTAARSSVMATLSPEGAETRALTRVEGSSALSMYARCSRPPISNVPSAAVRAAGSPSVRALSSASANRSPSAARGVGSAS